MNKSPIPHLSVAQAQPFVQDPNYKKFKDTIFCVSCGYVATNPIVSAGCRHTVCETCLNNCVSMSGQGFLQSKSVKCKQCGSCWFVTESTRTDPTLLTIIDSIVFHCMAGSCKWQGTRSELVKHVEECVHLYHCKCDTIILRDFIPEHEFQCRRTLINCSCSRVIAPDRLSQHMKEECPHAIVTCSAKSYGCLWNGIRESFKFHADECSTLKLCRKLIEKDACIQQLKTENKSLKRKLKELSSTETEK
jgi:hypothetical protein